MYTYNRKFNNNNGICANNLCNTAELLKPFCIKCNYAICKCVKPPDSNNCKKCPKGSRGRKGEKGPCGKDGTKVELICINYQGLSGCCLDSNPQPDEKYFFEPGEPAILYENKAGQWIVITPICNNYYYYDPIKCIIYHVKYNICETLCGNDNDLAIDCCNNAFYIYKNGCWIRKCTLNEKLVYHTSHISSGSKVVIIYPPQLYLTNKITNMEIVNDCDLPEHTAVYDDKKLIITFEDPLCLTEYSFQSQQYNFLYKIYYNSSCCLVADIVNETIICDNSDFYHTTVTSIQQNTIMINVPQGIVIDPSNDKLSFCTNLPNFTIGWNGNKVIITNTAGIISSMDLCYLITKPNGDVIRIYELIYVLSFTNIIFPN